jgi:glycosyltransferase involved in cell wall biosynthesis
MQKQPHILWLASWYPTRLDPFPGDFIQRHAKALALYYPVHVLHIAKDTEGLVTKSSLTEHSKEDNLEETIHYYHPFSTGIGFIDRAISTFYFLKAGRRLIGEEAKKHPGMFIHLHVAMRHGLLALWAYRKLSIPYVITEHWAGYNYTEFPKRLRPSKWFWMATKGIFSKASFFYPEVKRVGELVNETIFPIAFKPVSNTVDTRLFFCEPAKPPVDGVFHFVHVSTLSYQKNIEGILEVIEKLEMGERHIHFTLVGPASKEVSDRVEESAVLQKRVTLTGALSYPEVAEQMRKADALLMFSRYENQPCVIVEALCCGLPVISTKVGGIAEVMDETNGILIASEQKEELRLAIYRMVEIYGNFDRAAIAEKSAALYAYPVIGAQILEYYKKDLPNLW